MSQENYGFIGLGQMGYPMAKNVLLKIPSTSKLFICDLNQTIIDNFMQTHGSKGQLVVVKTPQEVAKNADTIITMLPESQHVKAVFASGSSALLSTPKGTQKLFIDCSTIDTQTSIEVGKLVEESGHGVFADAPVSGGPVGADAASLTFMIGAQTPETYEAARKVVSMMGTNVFHCGPVGSGVAVKAINNYLSGATIIACSEAMNIGVKLGLDPKVLASIINVSSGQCWVSKLNNPVPGVTPGTAANNGYNGGFAVELCRKVLGLAVGTAEMVGAKLVLSEAMLNTFDQVIADPRCAGKDARVVYRWLGGKEDFSA